MNRDANIPSDHLLVEDPRLDALLDEALSLDATPGGVPDQLSDRIFAATVGQLPTPVKAAAARETRDVVGRIGWTGALRRIAAVVAATAAVGAIILATQRPDQPVPTPGEPLAKTPHNAAGQEEPLDVLLQWQDDQMPLDVAIDELALALERPLDGSTDEWAQMHESLEAELDAMGLDDI